LTNAPIIGYLTELDIENVGALYVADNPRHPSVEEIRTLRVNLEFAGVDQPLKTIFVSSTEMEDGKTSVAANLAVVMSLAEKDVILLDADLRRPNVHNFFGLQNNYGLSDVFRGKLNLDEVLKEWTGGSVSVITAGDPPPNPAELLGSKKMAEVLEALEARADVVIIDGPPFIIADAPILASKVDGVLLIIRIGHSREPAIKSMMEQIDRAGAKVVGVALNRLPPKGIGYYAGTPYYSDYYSDEQESLWNMNQQRGWRDRLSFWPFNSRSKSKSSTRRVFDQIDVVDGDGEEYGWGE